jgi:hypothetical protein
MASASFQLKATDETASAFASVQGKLTKMHATAKQVGVGMATFFGFGAVVGGIKRMDAALEDAEKNATRLGLTSQDLDELTVATGFADDAAMAIQRTLALAAANLAGVFTQGDVAAKALEIRLLRDADALKLGAQEAANLDEQLQNVGLGQSQAIELDKKRAQQIRANAEAMKGTDPLKYQQEINKAKGIEIGVAQNLFSVNESYMKSREALGVAQSKMYGEEVSVSEKIIGLKAKESDIMGQLSLTDLDNQSKRIILQDQLVEIYGRLNPLIAESRQLATDAGQAIAQGFEDAAISGGNLSEIIKGLAQDLLRLVFKQEVTTPFAKGIGDFIAGMRAGGGPVGAGNAYVVGEKGPELFVPSSSGSIIPNGGGSGGRSGGSSINVTYNIASGVSRSDLAPILEQERKRLKAEIPDMVRRGGSYRAAFA